MEGVQSLSGVEKEPAVRVSLSEDEIAIAVTRLEQAAQAVEAKLVEGAAE